MVVLFGWSYFFTPTKPADNTNTAAAANNAAQPEQSQAPLTAAPVQPQQPAQQATAPAPDGVPNRTVTITTPLYEAKIDSKGAVATSWVILRTKTPKSDYPVYADGSSDGNRKPLQLISPKAIEQGELPFRLVTGDQVLNADLNGRN